MNTLLSLLQLASPALPVGAYSYSEGLESLIEQKKIDNFDDLCIWLQQELKFGSIRIETAVMVRAYRLSTGQNLDQDFTQLGFWNQWLSAARETQELREQSWQMGASLVRLLVQLDPDFSPGVEAVGKPCNYAIAYGLAAAQWQLPEQDTILAYLHSWSSNLINAGVKLIPLGQTQGQQGLMTLYPLIKQVSQEILRLEDDQLESCGWGLTLASMSHETQYSRLFRS